MSRILPQNSAKQPGNDAQQQVPADARERARLTLSVKPANVYVRLALGKE